LDLENLGKIEMRKKLKFGKIEKDFKHGRVCNGRV